MYISSRSAFIRNVAASTIAGAITLIILLIAPLGLLAVITNTLLITITTFTVNSVVDRVVIFLQPEQQVELLPKRSQSQIQYRNISKLNRRP